MISETPSDVKDYAQKSIGVMAVQWPATWSRQAAIAEYLGRSGIVFQFENGHAEPGPRTFIPQLFLFSQRYDRFNVRIGDWIVLHGSGRFSVVSRDEFPDYYVRSRNDQE